MPSIPEPFQAPSINLDNAAKRWRVAYPGELEVGDNVMNFGLITEISGTTITFAGNDTPIHFDGSSTLEAFTLED
jgi:hypothetical protein